MDKRKKTPLMAVGYIIFSFLILATVILLALYLTLVSLRDDSGWMSKFETDTVSSVKAPDIYQYHQRTNFLILGSDSSDGIERTDAIIVVSVDEKNANAALISIPRDTRIVVNGKTERLNAVFPNHGLNKTVEVVQELLNIPLHNYIKMDYKGFRNIIDLLGGVIIDVERPMVYDDYSQGLHIRLMPGRQRLNGEQSLQYVRFRDDGFGDISASGSGYVGRVARQQKFIEALVNELSRPANLGKLPALAPQLKDAIRTNMGPTEIVKWTTLAQKSRGFQVKTFVAHGASAIINDASYWILDRPRLESVIQEYFSTGKYGFSIGILNGSGSIELARDLASELRAKGFKVAGVSEVKEYQYQSTTIRAPGEFSEAVKWLKVNTELEDKKWLEGNSQLGDVSILLGRDMLN